MTNETGQGLERLSWLPERDSSENGVFIAGQKYYDIQFTGGAITGVTIDNLASPLPISSGGTGQATANNALNALLPSQGGNSGKALKTDGTNASWSTDTDTGITQLTGDVTAGPGSGSQAATLATVNSNVGSFGSSTSIPSITVNGKGLVTAASGNVVVAPAGTLTGATLASGVTASSLTSFGSSPTLVTPNIGVATATSVNKVAITAPATSATLTIANGKTLSCSNTLTFTGTDSSSVAFGSGGTVVYTDVTSLASLATVGTITSGTWNAGAVTSSGAVTGTAFVPTSSSVPANGTYLPAANTVGWSCSTAEKARLSATGLFVLCTQTPDSTHSGTLIANPSTTSPNLCSAGATASSTPLWQFFNTNGQVGNITVAASATAFNTSSDKRLKNNPTTISECGSIIDALEPVKFQWKTAAANTDYGLLAQDAYEIFPQAVTPGNDKEPGEEGFIGWSVDYSRFVPLLLAEIKSLRQRISALE